MRGGRAAAAVRGFWRCSIRVPGGARSGIEALLGSILPGLGTVDPALPPDAQLRAVEASVRWSMHRLAETSEGRRALAKRRAMLIGAVYELSTGHVRFLDV